MGELRENLFVLARLLLAAALEGAVILRVVVLVERPEKGSNALGEP
jgi:hypothetical protein